MAINQKHVFWEALVLSLVIFLFGFFIGTILENYYTQQQRNSYLESELNLIDTNLMMQLLDMGKITCEDAIIYNIEFGDKIFEDAKRLEEIEKKSQINLQIEKEHKRYDLLRTVFWTNSVRLKERCNADFEIIVYLYNFKTDNAQEVSKQEIFSRFLQDLKDSYPEKIILIPIAKDLDISSLNAHIRNYKISDVSIIVNQDNVYNDLEELYKIRNYLSS